MTAFLSAFTILFFFTSKLSALTEQEVVLVQELIQSISEGDLSGAEDRRFSLSVRNKTEKATVRMMSDENGEVYAYEFVLSLLPYKLPNSTSDFRPYNHSMVVNASTSPNLFLQTSRAVQMFRERFLKQGIEDPKSLFHIQFKAPNREHPMNLVLGSRFTHSSNLDLYLYGSEPGDLLEEFCGESCDLERYSRFKMPFNFEFDPASKVFRLYDGIPERRIFVVGSLLTGEVSIMQNPPKNIWERRKSHLKMVVSEVSMRKLLLMESSIARRRHIYSTLENKLVNITPDQWNTLNSELRTPPLRPDSTKGWGSATVELEVTKAGLFSWNTPTNTKFYFDLVNVHDQMVLLNYDLQWPNGAGRGKLQIKDFKFEEAVHRGAVKIRTNYGDISFSLYADIDDMSQRMLTTGDLLLNTYRITARRFSLESQNPQARKGKIFVNGFVYPISPVNYAHFLETGDSNHLVNHAVETCDNIAFK